MAHSSRHNLTAPCLMPCLCSLTNCPRAPLWNRVTDKPWHTVCQTYTTQKHREVYSLTIKRQETANKFFLIQTSDEVIIYMTSQKVVVWNSAVTPPWHWMVARLVVYSCRDFLSFPTSPLSSLISAPWDCTPEKIAFNSDSVFWRT